MDYICEKLTNISIVFTIIHFITHVLPWIYENIGPVIFGSKVNFRKYGEWALVTGATDGIGKSFAKQLAKKGLNIFLISRTQSKLECVAAEIELEFSVRTKILAIDFTHGIEIYDKIADGIKGYDIGVLVNNVGMCYDYPEYFLDVPNSDSFFDQIIRCNLYSTVFVSKIILSHMVKNKKGIIINLSSFSGTIPTPLLTVYSSSKTFMDKFSEDLSHEYYSKGIIVQSITPAFVATNITKITDTNIFMPNSDKYVEAALKTVGYATHTSGYLPHGIEQKLAQLLFSYFPFFKSFYIMFIMKICRQKWLRLHEIFVESKNNI